MPQATFRLINAGLPFLCIGVVVLSADEALAQARPAVEGTGIEPERPAMPLTGSSLKESPVADAEQKGGGVEEPAKVTTTPSDDIKTPLLKKLLEKGVLSHDEAAELEKEKKQSFLSREAEGDAGFGTEHPGPPDHDRPPREGCFPSLDCGRDRPRLRHAPNAANEPTGSPSTGSRTSVTCTRSRGSAATRAISSSAGIT